MAEQNLVPTQTQIQFENPMFREIHKNTWLKRISTNSKKVFCVHDDTDAFLETYVDNKLAVFHKPEWFVSLNNVQHISPTICAHEQEYEFVLTLTSEVIRLAAPTWEQMLDWVESLRGKLHELRILSPKENVYTKLPDRSLPLLPTRDPTSPLPPPPEVPPEILPGIEPLNPSESHSPGVDNSHMYGRRRSESQSSGLVRRNSNITEPRSARVANNVFTFDNLNLLDNATPPTSPPAGTANTHYELLFQMQQIPGQLVVLREYCSLPPQPYKTLREQQVLQLQKEIRHPSGVRIKLGRKDCISSIGFVDAFDAVWICGWKQKDHPMLYNALHIGDRLISIEGISIKSAAEAHKILHSHYCGLYVNIVIRRVPHGQVLVIHRESEGQSLGIIQENNTAVIEMVQADGLAARHGLTAKTKTCDGVSFTNWVLTEINGRPLNLFFKKKSSPGPTKFCWKRHIHFSTTTGFSKTIEKTDEIFKKL
ncbi:hypothetical protein NQ314_014250 [Rhamnusium bicolor]|uniref:PH domain-containing protein n=1 Tax=Rhamnusium bicolor TaxID=1586634 RepID=A0AAV8X3M7_9CUCU|nr:hypothetical protein NQ314_014250 [Rhamnusium bicolor]